MEMALCMFRLKTAPRTAIIFQKLRFAKGALPVSEQFEKLELNTFNVLRLLQECKATDATKNVVSRNFYDDESRGKAPVLELDRDKLMENRETIKYLVGQLHAVHKGLEFMSLPLGLMNYKGDNWTKENMALYALYYLGVSALALPPFVQVKGGAVSPISDFNIKPTFWPPKDEE